MLGKRSPTLDDAAWAGVGLVLAAVVGVEGIKNERRKEKRNEGREELAKVE